MSAENPPYNAIYIKAWTVLSILLGLVFMSLFLFGTHFLHAGQIVWNILRWLASPII